jgi:hypothetical protein
MNESPKGTAKVNGTPIDFYQGHFHVGFPFTTQTLIIKKNYIKC